MPRGPSSLSDVHSNIQSLLQFLRPSPSSPSTLILSANVFSVVVSGLIAVVEARGLSYFYDFFKLMSSGDRVSIGCFLYISVAVFSIGAIYQVVAGEKANRGGRRGSEKVEKARDGRVRRVALRKKSPREPRLRLYVVKKPKVGKEGRSKKHENQLLTSLLPLSLPLSLLFLSPSFSLSPFPLV